MSEAMSYDKSTLERLSNEFAMVYFGKVKTGNGERLLIQDTDDNQVLLDPVVLAAIVALDDDLLSKIVEKSQE
ncbi:hypothetical protein [Bacillus sp. 1P02SD]|uniref:hypothetical protein n=1 Tax=Bacillus sp. 1P02SD TaxID=3132264 RepID=UPI0039A329AD